MRSATVRPLRTSNMTSAINCPEKIVLFIDVCSEMDGMELMGKLARFVGRALAPPAPETLTWSHAAAQGKQ